MQHGGQGHMVCVRRRLPENAEGAHPPRGEGRTRGKGKVCGIDKHLITRAEGNMAAARVEAFLAVGLASVEEGADLTGDGVHERGHRRARGGRGGGSWRRERTTGMLAPVGVKGGVAGAQGGGAVVDCEFDKGDELGPVVVVVVDEGAEDVGDYAVDAFHLAGRVVVVGGTKQQLGAELVME